MSRSKTFRTFALAVACALSMTAHAVADTPKTVNVVAGNLTDALEALAKQCGVDVIYPSSQLKGLTTEGVSGVLETRAAFQELLRGTRLVMKEEGGSVLITLPTVEPVKITAQVPEAGVMRLAQTDSSQNTENQKTEESKDQTTASGASSEATDNKLDEIIVTGSRLSHGRAVISPVTVFTREDIERLGITTVGEILRVIPQNQGSFTSSPHQSIGASSYANLRGLGDGTTLVLINGQRPPASATSVANSIAPAQFNLNVIPSAAVDRIEVMTDGASAIYGSDAIGGVINVILRRQYSGVEVSAKQGVASDLTENAYTAVAGGQFGSLSAIIGGEFYEHDRLAGADRPYSARLDKTQYGGTNGFSPFLSAPIPPVVSAFPGTGNLPGLSAAFAAVPAGSPRPLTVQDFVLTQGQTNELVDYSMYQTVVQPLERSSGFVHGDFVFGAGWTLGIDGLYTKSKSNNDAIIPFVDMVLGAQNPNNPFGVDTLVSFYLPEVPISHSVVDTEDYGVALGVRGPLGAGWMARASAGVGESQSHQENMGADFFKVFEALMASDPNAALNPFFEGRDASPSLLRSLVSLRQEARAKTSSQSGAIGVAGPLLHLPTGMLEAALGADVRREAFDFELFTASSVATEPTTADADRDIASAYAELSIPVVAADQKGGIPGSIDLSVAARYENYSDFGSTTNPKVSMRWRPRPDLTFRGTLGTAFQAPSLSQLYVGPTVLDGGLFGPIFDPVLNETYLFQRFVASGNESLGAQEADISTVGLSFERPVSDTIWSASLDYYRIDFKDRIRAPAGVAELIDLERFFPQLVIRDPNTQRITDIRTIPINLSRASTEGFDFSLGYTWPAFTGRFDASLAGTYGTKYDIRVSPVAPVEDRLSYVGFSDRLKANAQLQYSRGNWGAAVTALYAHRYRSDLSPGEVRSHTTLDLHLSYRCCDIASTWFRNIKVDVGVVNLFDREPPFYDSVLGFDVGEGDPVQRRIYGKITAEFGPRSD